MQLFWADKGGILKSCTMTYIGGKGGYFEKLSHGSETLDMTSERLGEMFKGDSADRCGGKFPLVSMVGQADQ